MGTLTPSVDSNLKYSPIKPIVMDGFDIEKDLSPFKSATVSDSTVKVDDVISQINQLPQTT